MRKSKFRIAMIPTANAGVNYYRLASLAWQMAKFKNVEVAVFAFKFDMNEPHPWQEDLRTNPIVRRQITSLCDAADVVIWQPTFYPWSLDFFVQMRTMFEKPMLVETDDNYIDVPPWNEAHRSFGPNSQIRKIALEHMRMSDGIVVSTPYLADLYKRFNKSTTLVQNSLDFAEWDPVSPVRRHKRLRLGWIGGRSHTRELLMVAPVIKELLKEFPELWFYVVNSGLKHYATATQQPYVFEDCDRVQYTDRNVSINLYPRFMSSFGFDMGIAPLEDCHFNRGKSNLRWLEYSALRIPMVGTDISHYSQTVRDGQDGFLVKDNDLDVWHQKLKALIESAALRETIGEAAYKRVKTDFNIRKTAGAYLRRLKDIAGTGGSDEQDGTLYPDRGFMQRPESRPLHHIADRYPA